MTTSAPAGSSRQLGGAARLRPRPSRAASSVEPSLVELGQRAGRAIQDGEAGPRLARRRARPGSGSRGPASCSSIQSPACPPRTATTDASRPRVRAARATLRALPPGTDGEHLRAVDLAWDEAIDRGGLVDRGVDRDADESPGHGRRPGRSRAGPRRAGRPPPASSSVGWAAVPPTPRVESEPQATPSARHARERRRPASQAREEAGVERIAGAGRVDRLDRQRRAAGRARPSRRGRRARPAAPSFTATTRGPERGERPGRRLDVVEAGDPGRLRRRSGRKTSVSARSARDAAVPGLARVPVAVERGRRTRRPRRRGRSRAGPAAAASRRKKLPDVDVAGPRHQRSRARPRPAGSGDRPGRGQDRPVRRRRTG